MPPAAAGCLPLLCLAVHSAQVYISCACRSNGHGTGSLHKKDRMLSVLPHSAVEAAVHKGRTALVMVESPTNPRMQARVKGCIWPATRSLVMLTSAS